MIITIIDDDQLQRMLLTKIVEEDNDAISFASADEALEFIRTNPRIAYLIITDFWMPEKNGVEFIREVRAMDLLFRPYIILHTALTDAQTDMSIVQAGADDVVVKGTDRSILKARIAAGKRMLEEEMEHVKEYIKLKRIADHDELTGLYNRREGMKRVKMSLVNLQHYDHLHGCMIVMDLDKFKSINDTYGHTKGDEVLCEFSDLLVDLIGPYDTVFRYGGEEFVILTSREDNEGCPCDLAEQIRAATEAKPLAGINVTVSIGAYGIEDADPGLAKEYIEYADELLYQAKEQGRNRVVKKH